MEPRHSISVKQARSGTTFSKKRGYLSAFLALAILLLLLSAGYLLEEQMSLKLVSRGYEQALKFDYQLEGYYLLIRTGSLLPPEGTSYGSLTAYQLESSSGGRDYIEIFTDSSLVRVRGYYGDSLREEYVVPK